ncbi:unnamed protein product [Caenorhabditis angaria]|uniref:Protein kinase domain-containing protein n=1 Tax=Caenorhabditis angaria TaxID=860376 RepID=A0A9P1MZN2_9PELO|nr:unnamed protein product [Caenorhabditis angaria]
MKSWILQFFIIPILSSSVSWVKITKPTLIWEEMKESASGERIFYCGEFDAKYTGRYHWRFNGSSILPERTQIHKNQFTFLSGSNAIRNRLAGEYECCIRETLGNACYSRNLIVQNKTSIINANLIGLDDLKVEEGSTYYLKLLDVKRIENVKCTQDGENMDNFKYPLLGKNSKKSIGYHLKIENIEKTGLVNCEIRVQNKQIVEKSFLIRFFDDVPSFVSIQGNFFSKMEEDHKVRGGKLATNFMEKGAIIGSKRAFRIEKMVGGGGFGQIYRAIDLESRIVVAVKVEPKSTESGRIVLELNILLLLQHCVNIPKIFYSGEVNRMNYIVMQLLGKNLGDLRKYQRHRTLSNITTARVGIQCLQCLKEVHNLGYIHRDIKPSNICAGIGEHKRILYIVDFGMARKIRNDDGTFRPERTYASFRGTTRYVSITAHERKEQGFVDDIWSLFFSLCELSEGLSWKNLTDQDEIYLAKKIMLNRFQSRKLSRSFEAFPILLEKTERTEMPDYPKLIEILKTSCPNFEECSEFEWDAESEFSY